MKAKPHLNFDLQYEIDAFEDETEALGVLRKALATPNIHKKRQEALETILDYMWENERDNFISNPSQNHIFVALCRVMWANGGPAFWSKTCY